MMLPAQRRNVFQSHVTGVWLGEWRVSSEGQRLFADAF
jgi:hypothetical protein